VADTAVAVHPERPARPAYIGKKVAGRSERPRSRSFADDSVERVRDGVVKVTPAHDASGLESA